MAQGLSWEPIALPEGPQIIPDWCKGLGIQWMDGYGNHPNFVLKTPDEHAVHDWPGKVWHRRDDGFYYATHEDGRGAFLSHSGTVGPITLQGPKKDENGNVVTEPNAHGFMTSVWEDYTAIGTTQQDGFASRHFPIVMGSGPYAGQTVILRGPWYGSCLPGYLSITTVGRDLIENKFWSIRHHRPWWERGGCFGLFITEDLLVRLFARYQPHLRLVRTRYNWLKNDRHLIEPLKPEWDAPKAWMLDRERVAA